MQTIAARREKFRALHAQGCFVLPNPWDGGSAIRCAKAGFEAIASTSAGAAWALGKNDGEMSVDEVLAHLQFLCSIADLPVNADFEAGFAETPDGVARNVTRCIATGVAGLSIEDRNGRAFFAFDEAVARVAAARRAIDASGENVILVGRCETYLMPQPDMPEIIRRLKAYAAAGADCVYAIGLKNLEQISEVVRAVDRPVNANLTGTGLSVAQMAGVGVRRVSVGAALAKATYGALEGYLHQLKGQGTLP